MKIPHRAHLLPVLLLCAGAAQAAAYKCTQANGTIAFQDKPCSAKDQGAEIHIDGIPAARKPVDPNDPQPAEPAPPDTAKRKPKGGGDLSDVDVSGSWCDYAQGAGPDDTGTTERPAEWDLAANTMSYRELRDKERVSGTYERDRDTLYFDVPALGGKDRPWAIIRKDGNELLLQQINGDVHHLRAGACDEPK